MALSVSCTCCALVKASAECCGYLCYPSAVKRLWPLWSNPVPLSLIRCKCVVPLFLRCCVICHMVLIALKSEKVLWLPLRSYRLYSRISQFRFDSTWLCPRSTLDIVMQGLDTMWEEKNKIWMLQCPPIFLSDHLPESACSFLGRLEFGEAMEMNPSCVLCTDSLLGDR